MWFVVVGVVLTALKALDWAPMKDIGWLWVLLPFVLALLWWYWSDTSGRTKRLEMEKAEVRKAERRRRNIENLGMTPKDRPPKR